MTGFTLVETIIALVLSSVVLILVSTTFVVQSQYYSSQTLSSAAHDNARAATELVASEIRSVMDSGVVVAGKRTLTLRSAIVVGGVCDRTGFPNIEIFTEGGEADLDTAEVAGLAVRIDSTASWHYAYTGWDAINGNVVASASRCADHGADTADAVMEFHHLKGLNGILSEIPDVGDVVMLFRETTFTIQQSQLDSTTLSLYRRSYGDAAVEFATGLDTTAQFQYRSGGTSYVDTVAANLADIDAIRIVADAREEAESGGQKDITFGWSVNVALRNVR